MRLNHVAFLSIMASLLSLGCSETAPGGVSAPIDRAGGELIVTDGPARGARVVVPPNAVDTRTTFTIEAGEANALDAGLYALGPMVTFGPENTAFATPVQISVPARSEPMVLLTRHGGQPWTRVDGAVWDPETQLVTAEVMHFSDFVPVARGQASEGDAGLDPRCQDESRPECVEYRCSLSNYEDTEECVAYRCSQDPSLPECDDEPDPCEQDPDAPGCWDPRCQDESRPECVEYRCSLSNYENTEECIAYRCSEDPSLPECDDEPDPCEQDPDAPGCWDPRCQDENRPECVEYRCSLSEYEDTQECIAYRCSQDPQCSQD